MKNEHNVSKDTTTENTSKVGKKKLNKKRVAIIATIGIILILLALSLSRCSVDPIDVIGDFQPIKQLQDNGDATDGTFVGMTAEEIKAKMTEDQKTVRTRISSQSILQDGVIHTMIENLEENDTIWQASYVMQETGETVAMSPAIHPGQYVKEITPSYIPPAGDYMVDIVIDFYEVETETFITKKIFVARLTVK